MSGTTNCPCFCPSADTPVAPILAAQGGPGAVFDVTLYGSLGFSVAIISNPTFQPSGTPSIALVQIVNGNILRITTGSPDVADTIAAYDGLIRVSNACGSLDIPIRVEVVADLNPIVTNCALAQTLWTPDPRVPTVGDTLLAFTPLGCRALLPPLLPDTCGDIQAFPPVVPTLATQLATADCGLATVADVIALVDVCAALQAFPVALPGPLDTVYGQQAGVCSQFTIFDIAANVDICTLLQNLPNAVVQPTAVFYGQQAGQCFEFAVADLLGLIGAAPILAADGSCAAPSYSFASSPDSGMFYDPSGVGSVIIGDDNCADAITVGASIGLITAGVQRLTLTNAGEWDFGGSVGAAGEVFTSAGPGLPPSWQPTGAAVVACPLLASCDGSAPAPVYSWASRPDAGVYLIDPSASAPKIGVALEGLQFGRFAVDDFNFGQFRRVVQFFGERTLATTTYPLFNLTQFYNGHTNFGHLDLHVHASLNVGIGLEASVAGLNNNANLFAFNNDPLLGINGSRVELNNGLGGASIYAGVSDIGSTNRVLFRLENRGVPTTLFQIARDETLAQLNITMNDAVNGAAANLGTLANAPAAGNPTFWLRVNINGVNRFIPAW